MLIFMTIKNSFDLRGLDVCNDCMILNELIKWIINQLTDNNNSNYNSNNNNDNNSNNNNNSISNSNSNVNNNQYETNI